MQTWSLIKEGFKGKKDNKEHKEKLKNLAKIQYIYYLWKRRPVKKEQSVKMCQQT